MGDMADMILDGTLCEQCGVILLDEEDTPPGYPDLCPDCRADAKALVVE